MSSKYNGKEYVVLAETTDVARSGEGRGSVYYNRELGEYVTRVELVNDVGGGGDVEVSWSDIQNKPSTFTPSSHTHTIENVTGLQDALDSKQAAGDYAPNNHTHTIANVTGLQDALDSKQASGDYAPVNHAHATGIELLDPETAELADVIAKVNELITALKG